MHNWLNRISSETHVEIQQRCGDHRIKSSTLTTSSTSQMPQVVDQACVNLTSQLNGDQTNSANSTKRDS